MMVCVWTGMEVLDLERCDDADGLLGPEAEGIHVLLTAAPRNVRNPARCHRPGHMVQRPDEFGGKAERIAALRTCIAR
jgi:hypothetical protein